MSVFNPIYQLQKNILNFSSAISSDLDEEVYYKYTILCVSNDIYTLGNSINKNDVLQCFTNLLKYQYVTGIFTEKVVNLLTNFIENEQDIYKNDVFKQLIKCINEGEFIRKDYNKIDIIKLFHQLFDNCYKCELPFEPYMREKIKKILHIKEYPYTMKDFNLNLYTLIKNEKQKLY